VAAPASPDRPGAGGAFAIKVGLTDPAAPVFVWPDQKTMYGGRHIAAGDRSDGRPEPEQNFKLYRQATDKIVGLSAAAAAVLDGFF
jgi:hypothetical protein